MFVPFAVCLSLYLKLWNCLGDVVCDAPDTRKNLTLEQFRGHEIMSNSMETSGYDTITQTLLLNETNDVETMRSQILKYFHDTFDIFSSLYENINEDSFWVRSDPLRHPVGWYLAHCSCFYVNKLRVSGVTDRPVNDEYESMFAIGVDEMSWDDKLQDRDDWPNVKDVKKYRAIVREFVTNIINTLPMHLPIDWDSKWWIILMGIEHERIHLETSSVLIRQLPIDTLKTDDKRDAIWDNECQIGKFNNSLDFVPNLGAKDHSPENELIALPKSVKNIEYGRKVESTKNFDLLPDYMVPVYGWDNEFGDSIIRDVPSFSVSKYLVSNEEYYEFVLDNGYNNKDYWSDEGWKWRMYNNAQYPKFWIKDIKNNEWKYRTLLNIIDMPWDWPVITNHLESLAFTNWKSKKLNKNIRLPTEDEWIVLRKGFAFSDNDSINNELNSKLFTSEQPTWDIAPGNINLEYFTSESPIDMFEFGNTGIYDIIGNVWQHTLTAQHPFNGFKVHPFYDDFTVPCFGNAHNLLKGGSWISTGNEAISFSRYQFRRHFFQFAGIRYIEDTNNRDLSFLELISDSSSYNSNEMVDLYTHFHYWDEKYFNVKNFAVSVADVSIKYMNKSMNNRALDLGCATGRSTFELARVFNHVTGIDWTARLIGIGYRLKQDRFLEWKMKMHGEIMKNYKITLDDLNLNDDSLLNRVEFYQNDAQNLDVQYTGYDLIVASNLIDRLANPMLFLNNIHERINQYGKLIILSPYTWLEEYTAKEKWIGGKYDQNTNKALTTFDELKRILSKWFIFENDEYVEMVIRETENKYQHTTSHCTVWTKK